MPGDHFIASTDGGLYFVGFWLAHGGGLYRAVEFRAESKYTITRDYLNVWVQGYILVISLDGQFHLARHKAPFREELSGRVSSAPPT